MLDRHTVQFCCVFVDETETRLFVSRSAQQNVTDQSGSYLLEGLADIMLH